MKNNTLQNAFPIVAAAIGNRFGIKVQIGGDQAYTNGKSIQLPAYNGSDPDYKDYAWGLLAHEAAHIRYSDFSIDFGTSVLRRRLCGAIEDVRIEHELAKDFPGTRLTLRTVVEKMIASGGFKAATAEDHPANVLYGYVLKSLRAGVLGQTALTSLVELSEQALKTHFPAGAVIRLKGLLSEVPEELKSEMDCLHLADRILTMIEQECEQQTQQQQNSVTQADSDADADSNAGQGDSHEEQEDQSPDSSDDSDTASSPDSLEPGDADDAGSNSATGSELDDQQSKQSVSQGSTEENESMDFQPLQEALQSVSDTELDQDVFEAVKAELTLDERNVAESVMPIGLRQVGNEAAGLRLLHKVQSESVKIRAALQGLVQAQNMSRTHQSCLGHRVIGRRLPQLALGDGRVFARGSVKSSPNTAIHLLLDKSESMSYQVLNTHSQSWESRLTIALEATLALALAFEGIPGVNPGITAFPGIDDESVFRVLEHGERVRSKVGGFSLQALDSTPMTEAIWFGAASLLRCREPRKVLMVMTDGQPNDPLTTLEILQRCRDSGIETVGIGLGIDVSHLFPRAIAINDFRGLRSQLFELSKTVLMAS
ncbi:VWA domain-containing protein [Methylobacter svalbardensis]|uniref:VWA domain-containing protein n=1 Tax=Methylobacter svalbardensis TaxID=3080016 RepID=UPI0030EEDB69